MTTFFVIFFIIFIIMLIVYKYDKIPDFNKISEKALEIIPIDSSKNAKKDQGLTERPLKIKLDSGNENLTQDDVLLRDTLFEKHIQHYKVFEGPSGEIKAHIPFQAVIFLTRNYSPLVNEFGEIVVSVTSNKNSLIVDDKNNPGSIVGQENDYLSSVIGDKDLLMPKSLISEDTESTNTQNRASFLGDFSGVDDDSDVDLDELFKRNDDEMDFGIETDLYSGDVNSNPFEEDFNSVSVSTQDVKILTKDDHTNEDPTFTPISKNIINESSIIAGKIDFMDSFDLIDKNSDNVQYAIINNFFLENQVAFLEDKSIFIPLKTISKALSLALSSVNRIQLIIDKELKNHKNIPTVEDLLAFILSNKKYVIQKNDGKVFHNVSIKCEDGNVCKTQGIKLSAFFIKENLPDEYDFLMKNPMKSISISESQGEKFC